MGWIDITDAEDVSRTYRIGRRYAWRDLEILENKHFTVVGPQLGVLKGCRIIGEYVLQQDDLLLDKRFDDVVMCCYAHHENHAYDYANESDLAQIWIDILGSDTFAQERRISLKIDRVISRAAGSCSFRLSLQL